ncbi:RmlC-like cupin domain-containing protein [Choanephora cucurbitarum]|nr:RmlC-like cupin domain-containing protein [Choanephora cucurbitarum]
MAPPQEPITLPEVYSMESTEMESKQMTLTDLVQSIHRVLGDEGLDSDKIDAKQIIALMEQYSSNAVDWNKYTLFDHSRAYTRNLIDDGNGKFNLMILAWSKGQKSPIHDHAGSHCVMKILDGELQETLFDWPVTSDDCNQLSSMQHDTEQIDITANRNASSGTGLVAAHIPCSESSLNGQPLVVAKDTVYRPNQVTYVHDKIGLHRISNPSTEQGAVSLHLYTPPYKMCKTFEEKTGKARSSGVCSFYSIGGNRI